MALQRGLLLAYNTGKLHHSGRCLLCILLPSFLFLIPLSHLCGSVRLLAAGQLLAEGLLESLPAPIWLLQFGWIFNRLCVLPAQAPTESQVLVTPIKKETTLDNQLTLVHELSSFSNDFTLHCIGTSSNAP